MMGLVLTAAPPPLAMDGDGVARVAGTRVTLDSVVAAFQEGATPEEITQQYPTLGLADVYAAISHYLQHRADVEQYLRDRQEGALRVRRENEARWDPNGIRERLLARRNAAPTSGSRMTELGEPPAPAPSG